MMTLDEVVELLRTDYGDNADGDTGIDRSTVETYVERTWVRPVEKSSTVYFEEIDVARIRLINHMKQEFMVDDEAMDIVLSLLDQLYGARERMRCLTRAIEQQPRRVQAEIFSLLTENDSGVEGDER